MTEPNPPLRAASSLHFLVIGEICLDVFVSCKINRLAPEAPVALLNPISSKENYGMAGNVVANLKSLGAGAVSTVTPLCTIVKTRYVDQATGYLITRVDEHDEVAPVAGEDIEDALIPSQFDAVLIVDYNKGMLSEKMIVKITNLAHKFDLPVFMDTKKLLGEWSKQIDFVKINTKEYVAHEKAGIANVQNYCRNLIVTMGDKGVKNVTTGQIVPVDPIAIADLSGSGDSFHAALAIRYLQTKDIAQAMDYANRVARIAASKRGVVAVMAGEVV